MRAVRDPSWVQPVPTLDLRKFCAHSDKIETEVRLRWDWHSDYDFTWLKLGKIGLAEYSSFSYQRGSWFFTAELKDCTETEHNAVPVLRMELVGVILDPLALSHGKTFITGVINPNLNPNFDSFTFYNDYGFDPSVTPETCKNCNQFQRGSDLLRLPNNMELYNQVKGKRIEIITGTKLPNYP